MHVQSCDQDLTGFNGRCDAIYFTASDETPDSAIPSIDEMRRELNWKEIQDCPETFDLVVVGGGIAGICTALAAVRSGVDVCLINDRGVLGGCNSSEIRVCMGGMINLPPYDKIGNLVREISPVMGDPSIFKEEYFEDNRKLLSFENRRNCHGKYKILLNECVTEIVKKNSEIVHLKYLRTLYSQAYKILDTLLHIKSQ